MPGTHNTGLTAPDGRTVEAIERSDGLITVMARSSLRTSAGPRYGEVSGSVHSRYLRTLADLPSRGSAVSLRLSMQWFGCRSIGCPVKVFAGQPDPSVAQRLEDRQSVLKAFGPHLDRWRVDLPLSHWSCP